MPITTQYRMAPRPGYRLSPVLRLVQSRISSVNRLCNFIPAAPNSVRIASAVRPCRPITLPKSSGCVFNSRTVTWEPSTALTCTPSGWSTSRSEEHTSELQSHHDLVCRLLLEKKKSTHARSRTTTHYLQGKRSCRLYF